MLHILKGSPLEAGPQPIHIPGHYSKSVAGHSGGTTEACHSVMNTFVLCASRLERETGFATLERLEENEIHLTGSGDQIGDPVS